MKYFLTQLLQILTPQKCVHCRTHISSPLCSRCETQLRFGITQTASHTDTSFYSLFPYENAVIKSLIYRLKNRPHYNLLSYFINKEKEPFITLLMKKAIAIVEIPPHTKTFLFPHLRLLPLYKNFCSNTTVVYLKRTRTTKKQGTLSIEERKRNQKDSLKLLYKRTIPSDIPILIIDDVITTGSSIKEAYNIIRSQHPHNHIIIITLAYAKKFRSDIFIKQL